MNGHAEQGEKSHVQALNDRSRGADGYREKLHAQRSNLGKHTDEMLQKDVNSVTPPSLSV